MRGKGMRRWEPQLVRVRMGIAAIENVRVRVAAWVIKRSARHPNGKIMGYIM